MCLSAEWVWVFDCVHVEECVHGVHMVIATFLQI